MQCISIILTNSFLINLIFFQNSYNSTTLKKGKELVLFHDKNSSCNKRHVLNDLWFSRCIRTEFGDYKKSHFEESEKIETRLCKTPGCPHFVLKSCINYLRFNF